MYWPQWTPPLNGGETRLRSSVDISRNSRNGAYRQRDGSIGLVRPSSELLACSLNGARCGPAGTLPTTLRNAAAGNTPQWSPTGTHPGIPVTDVTKIVPQWNSSSKRRNGARRRAAGARAYDRDQRSARVTAMEPAADQREHPAYGEHWANGRRAAMEPAADRREHLTPAIPNGASLSLPQWSPPLDGGSNLGTTRYRRRRRGFYN